jgi:hypothetical protein
VTGSRSLGLLLPQYRPRLSFLAPSLVSSSPELIMQMTSSTSSRST